MASPHIGLDQMVYCWNIGCYHHSSAVAWVSQLFHKDSLLEILASCKENHSELEEEQAFEVWYRLEQMEGVSPDSLQEVQQVCNSELRRFDKSVEQDPGSYAVEHSEVEEEQAVNQIEEVCYRQV